ncbi:MAG TPA: PQQ-dependent sugar dehydrogenase [Luteitalea sp.]|nr:PQQ-dependent sugar dehydrogenase [Luteitalea sp.]
MRVVTSALVGGACLALAGVALIAHAQPATPTGVAATYATACANCHGPSLQGGQGPSLVDDENKHGDSDEAIARVIADGVPNTPMMGFKATMSPQQIRALVIYIREGQARARTGRLPAGPPPFPERFTSERHAFRAEVIASGLDTPWGLEFLPDGALLVSERPGRLRTIRKGVVSSPIGGVPTVWHQQDGGLLDIAIHPRFAENGWVYLAYTETGNEPRSSSTRIIRGTLLDGVLVDQRTIFKPAPDLYWDNNSHYGARLLFDRDERLFFSIGDRGHMRDSQDLASPYGKLHRVTADGDAPSDNPFAGRKDATRSIWSYGHRNQQGLAVDPRTGRLWATEHGPRGGDELNLIAKGRNYGWPDVTFGMNDNGTPITDRVAGEGLESPVTHWTPSIAVCGIAFYNGRRFPGWDGDLLVTALAGQQLRRLTIRDDKVTQQEVLLRGFGRVRDVRVGTDGLVYLALNDPGRIVRLVPVE